MKIVGDCYREGIFEYGLRLFEAYPMDSNISRRLFVIPFEDVRLHSGPRLSLQLVEKRNPRILAVQLRQLAHDLLAALVVQVWNGDIDGDDLVASLARMRCAFHAPFAHAQLLPALC